MGCTHSQPDTLGAAPTSPPARRLSGATSKTATTQPKTPPQQPRRLKKKSSTSSAGAAAATRQRLDSWATPTTTTTTTLQQHVPPRPSGVETQWKYLWNTYKTHLVDPVDVPAVLQGLFQRTINRLSPTQIIFLQRKVRWALSADAAQSSSNNNGGSSSNHHYHAPQNLVAKVWNSSSSSSSGEARVLAEKSHVLADAVWQRVLPSWKLANDNNDNSNNNDTLLLMLLTNVQHLLWHMSAPPDRVTAAAAKAAQAAQLNLDVNHWHVDDDDHVTMPKPSCVEEWTEAPPKPTGVTLTALATLLALATAGTRTQQLQLLFYLCVQDLPEFLAWHPAGGVPVWLLEVVHDDDNNSDNSSSVVLVSLASLTHYHYYGTAFLPDAANAAQPPPPFMPSASRQPVAVSRHTVQRLVQALLTAPPAEKESLSENHTTLNGSSSHKSAELVSHHHNNNYYYYYYAQDHHTTWSIFGATTGRELFVGGAVEAARVQAATAVDSAPPHDDGDDDEWTLQEYSAWAQVAINDTALSIIMHRLLGAGILPSHALEKELVQTAWETWQQQSHNDNNNNSLAVQRALGNGHHHASSSSPQKTTTTTSAATAAVWGGLGGGVDGNGVLYCIDKTWWDDWSSFVGWSWLGERPNQRTSFTRPASLSNEALLDRTACNGGTMGSYEWMRHGLKKNKDYVLVPPAVWNVLYELYGGGPPLPRLVEPLEHKFSDASRISSADLSESYADELGDSTTDGDYLDAVMEELGLDAVGRVLRLPESVSVTTHPWIVHVQLCDPTQPYRRGDAGITSIRVMVTPDAPLWRMLAEIINRFPLMAYKAFDAHDKQGKARLWKRTEPTGAKGPISRYGPWNLLCKSRHARLPEAEDASDEDLGELIEDWKAYCDNATVESILLTDQDHLMFEFAVQNKQGHLIWPREAAAKAGRVRRLVEEENEFRRILQGVDSEGNLLLKPPNLLGMDLDAMDASGRWYPVKILAVEIVEEDTTDEEGAESDTLSDDRVGGSTKRVKVDFSEHGGHVDWIDVDSDRLGPPGRFTNEAEQQQQGPATTKTNGSNGSPDSKSKGPVVMKKSGSADNTAELAKLCPLPGYGACGLTNLGNTCYMNSALQCISYLPLLRSYLLSGQFKKTGDLNRENPLGTGGKLLEESADLLRVMWSARLGEKSPTRFKAQLGRINSQFSGADQQDAQEFLNYILDVLHEDSNRVQNKPYVEALEDDWVKKTSLSRVGEEAWRRFLRRNRSIMADVAMGQVLNTVTCPVCDYSSRNFDPFNLLSIPIPTVADVVFQCTVIRRATAYNCPWVLNKPRRGSKRSSRYPVKEPRGASGPPSDSHVAEQYVVTMSRLADSKDLRVQIQKLCGIPAARLRLCRAEEATKENSKVPRLSGQTKLIPLNDKEGPCSQLARKRLPNENSPVAAPTVIIAFESTLNLRREREESSEDETVADEEMSVADERAGVQRHLDHYGDGSECRLVDSYPLVLAKAMSKSLWPRTEEELRVGLRVDAKDHRGNWFAGSVIDIFDEIVGGDADTGEEVRIENKKVCVHFDNFSSKWDETYGIDHFKEGTVRPLYLHASPKAKPTEFLVFNRRTDPRSGQPIYFGQPLYVQCQNEWSNARAGAQIFGQTSRFMQYRPTAQSASASDESASGDPESRVRKVYDRACSVMSDLIDLLVEYDRQYVRSVLGVSEQNGYGADPEVFRNPSFDASSLSASLASKVAELMPKLPFEIRLCSSDPSNADKSQLRVEEELFPLTLTRTIGNYMNARNVIVLHWRAPPRDRKTSSSVRAPVMYVEPTLHVHTESAEILKKTVIKKKENGKNSHPGSAGMDLGVCLTEFCKMQKLSLDDNWRCPRCKEFREGKQDMNLWRLPDLLTFHIKRFNMSARWREKITTKVNFPLTGLDMSEWCHEESTVRREDPPDSYIYDLIGVMNHYGSMTGGHYVATCKATGCNRDGREEAGYGFNGVGVSAVESEESDTPSGWRLGRPKPEVNQGKAAAAMTSRAVSQSAEPMWLQFDDELVEPIPPDHVVSEMAYVLFYRRRRISPSNIAAYSTLE